MDTFRYECVVTAHTDALYLGVSLFGIKKPGQLSWGGWHNTQFVPYAPGFVRVFNMLSRHAILYISDKFHQHTIEASLQALTYPPHTYAGDIGYAMLQPNHLVLAPHDPICYQSEKFKGNHPATKHPLRVILEQGN